MAITDISGVSNSTLWALARKASPKFRSHTAEATADLFTEKGFEALKLSDIGAINEFFEISLRVAFQMVTVARAKNIFEGSGLLQVYDTPNGGYVQRMSMETIKPVSPAFKGLQDLGSVDPFIVRKPKSKERFFPQNFDFQSFVTIQDFQVKTIFVSEYGMGQFLAGIMQTLQNGYTVQESLNVKEAINKALNSDEYVLQDTQVVRVSSWTEAAPTASELGDMILGIKNIFSNMASVEQTSAYNAGRFASAYEASDHVILMRAGIKNRIALELELGAFNPDRLSLPAEITEVDNFGGMIPYYIDDNEERHFLTPKYNEIGEEIGYEYSDDTETYTVSPTGWLDPNEDVLAIIAQKGLVFENRQNPYEVSPIYNPRGLYTNYWASSPNNSIVVDPYYNLIAICKPANA